MRLTGKPLELTLNLIKQMKDDAKASVSIEVAMSLVDTIEALQQENEQLKDENASIRNWNACEEKLHNELLESDKRRWELELELEDANNYRAGLEAIVDKLRAHVMRMSEILSAAHICTSCGEIPAMVSTDDGQLCEKCAEELDAVEMIDLLNYHNPADVEALRKAREAIRAAWGDGSANAAMDKASEALTAIDKAIGGKEDV